MTYFVTGATGFIGRRLVERLLERKGKIHVLVREDSLGRLDELIEHWEAVCEATVSRRIHPAVGDLRMPLLGLEQERISELEGTVEHFFHLAAVYDMTAPVELDMAVNVGGTNHALELAAAIRAERFHHVSSIAVAGAYKGVFGENQFDEGQRLPSPYHATKFEAERTVREQALIPWRVYRPGIVVGDSRTGEMDKVDGPYYFFKAIQRMRQVVPQWMPLVGLDLGKTNIVPVDWVAGALDHIAHRPNLDGQAFHLTYQSPQKVDEVINELAAAAHAPRFAVSVDKRVLDAIPTAPLSLLMKVPPLRQARKLTLRELGIPDEVLEHLDLVPTFDTRQAERALAGSEWERPPALARVRGAPVGLLGARDGSEHQPRAHLGAGDQGQAHPDHRRLLGDRQGVRHQGGGGWRRALAGGAQRGEARGDAR